MNASINQSTNEINQAVCNFSNLYRSFLFEHSCPEVLVVQLLPVSYYTVTTYDSIAGMAQVYFCRGGISVKCLRPPHLFGCFAIYIDIEALDVDHIPSTPRGSQHRTSGYHCLFPPGEPLINPVLRQALVHLKEKYLKRKYLRKYPNEKYVKKRAASAHNNTLAS